MMKTLRFKLFSAFTLFVIFPWITVFTITTFTYASHLKEKYVDDSLHTLQQSLNTFHLNLDVAKRYLDLMFTSEVLNNLLTENNFSVYDYRHRRAVLDMDEYLTYIVGDDDAIAGAVIFVNDKPVSNVKFTYWDDSIQQSAFYQRLKNAGGTIVMEESLTVKDPYLNDREFICLGRQIKRIEHTSKGLELTDEIVGNALLFLDKQKIFDRFSAPFADQTISMALVSQSAPISSTLSKEQLAQIQKAVLCLDSAPFGSFSSPMPDHGKKDFVMYAKNAEFTVYAVAESSALFRNIDYFFGIVIFVQVFCGIAFLVFTLITRTIITTPIAVLNEALLEVTKGNLDVSVSISSKDELGSIGNTFNSMVDDLKKKIRQIHSDYQVKTSMEIAMLQYQINPHFLYNVLSSIRLKALMNKDNSVALMLQRVSRLLRRTIGKSGEDITLHEELVNIDDYIFIHTQIFNVSIVSSISVSDELLCCSVPNMLLQPIVENCFVHGIEDLDSFCIIIKCKQAGEDLVITVSDDGVGMSPETINRILEGQPQPEKDTFNKIGINSVNQRLKLKYGQRYGVTMHSEIGKYTKVTITLPFLLTDEKEELIRERNAD